MTVPPLAGFTVAVTAHRRRHELASLLERHGARTVTAPAIRIAPLADDEILRAATLECLAAPLDAVVVTTAIGFRGWMEAADGWGLGDRLVPRLAAAHIAARGPKARGAIRAAGLADAWYPASESTDEVLSYLLERGVSGQRVAVQLHGEPIPGFADALRSAGAQVVEVPVYRWEPHEDDVAQRRLVEQVIGRAIDAVTFTSAPAVTVMLRLAEAMGVTDALLEALRRDVLAVCVGHITAGPLTALGIPTVQPDRARLGALVRAVSSALPAGSPRLSIGGHAVQLRGHAILVDEDLVALPPTSLAVLRALAVQPGRVYSRAELLAALPAIEAGEHAVEMAVTRLRAAVGGAKLVETVIKRGYRLLVDVPVDSAQSTGRSA